MVASQGCLTFTGACGLICGAQPSWCALGHPGTTAGPMPKPINTGYRRWAAAVLAKAIDQEHEALELARKLDSRIQQMTLKYYGDVDSRSMAGQNAVLE